MGYFPNDDAGINYEIEYCERCVHHNLYEGGCAVWRAHMLHDCLEQNNEDSILHILIPRSADKLDNEQCRMFWPKGTR